MKQADIRAVIEALEGFNLKEDQIISGSANALVLRVPIAAIQKAAAALSLLRAGQEGEARDADSNGTKGASDAR